MEIYKPQIVDFESKETLYNHLASYLVDRILEINGDEGAVRICLTGGKSVLPIYKILGEQVLIPWEKVQFYLSDERLVDTKSEKSNQYQISQTFGENFLSEAGEVNFFETNLPIEQVIKNYQEKLENIDGNLFDLTVLGVGPDGHIASLFPGGSYLRHHEDKVLATTAPAEFDVSKRVSLSIESLLDSKEILLLVVGDSKKYIPSEILQGTRKAVDFPVKFLLANPNFKIFYCPQD
jgi:6-phosphogluconolactonase